MAIPQIRNISSLSVDDTIKWSDQAVRLAKMDEIITSEPHSGTPQGRQSVIDRLNGLIRKIGAGQELPIGSLDALEGKVIKLYNSIPASQFIGTLAKDVGSVQIPPIKKSMLGMNGPTYLISYPRTGIYTGVFKLTNEVEFSSGAILNIFLRALRDPLIKVPAASFFDINQKRRLSLSESGTTVSPLKNREPNDLGVNFYRFLTLDACKIPQDLLAPDPSHGESSAAKRVDLFDTVIGKLLNDACLLEPESIIKTNRVMISEKVMGSNLRDFVMNGAYARLPDEQKEILLRAVARLVTLDLFVLGHTDRIHQMAENFSGFKKDEPSNIGNVMVEVSEATSEVLSLYAIDNSSIESEAEKSLYNTFLEGFNGDEQGVLNLAQNIQDSLTKAFAKDSKYLNGFVSSATNLDSLYESEIDRNPLVIEVKVRIEELKNELANVEYENTKDVEYAIEDAQSELSDVIEEVKSAVYKKHGVANRPIHFISDVKKFRAENAVFEFEIESVMNRLKSLNLELMVECCDSVNSVLSSAKSRINILKTRGVHA